MPQVGLGSYDQPLDSKEPMEIALGFLTSKYYKDGVRTLHEYRQMFWLWEDGMWKVKPSRWLEDRFILWSKALWWSYLEYDPDEEQMVEIKKKIPARVALTHEVVRFLQALIILEDLKRTPAWMGEGECPVEIGPTIGFKDKLVDCRNGIVADRDARWFDNATLPVNYVPDAPCPRWMQALQEWSDGEEAWIELLQRIMGYCLMSKREYAKWVLFQGVARSGKGVITRLLQAFVGGSGYFSTTLGDLAGSFGLDGAQASRILTIGEGNEVDGPDGERLAALFKLIVGRDPVSINVKHVRQELNIVLDCVPILLSNEVPKLPNKGRGLSIKMLVLPFKNSFAKRPDYELEKVLHGQELEGIAAWCVEGAKKLEAASLDPPTMWPEPEGSKAAMKSYHLANNPFDAFLEARFIADPKGGVTTKAVWEQWVHWRQTNMVSSHHTSRNFIARDLCEKSSWRLARGRSHQNVSRLTGLSLRREYEDEV